MKQADALGYAWYHFNQRVAFALPIEICSELKGGRQLLLRKGCAFLPSGVGQYIPGLSENTVLRNSDRIAIHLSWVPPDSCNFLAPICASCRR
jgi:hypothetical protein